MIANDAMLGKPRIGGHCAAGDRPVVAKPARRALSRDVETRLAIGYSETLPPREVFSFAWPRHE